MKNYLDRYLAGETPLHPERLIVPSDEELDAAEAAFDRIVAERESQATVDDKTHRRVVRLWPWAVAASILLFIGIGIALWSDKEMPPKELVAKAEPTIIGEQQLIEEPVVAAADPIEESVVATAQPVETKPRIKPRRKLVRPEKSVEVAEEPVTEDETPDPYYRSPEQEVLLAMEAHEQDIRLRGKRLQQEIAALSIEH